jgi:geranylgeranyl transferase type-2 subunit alpha
VWQAALYGQLAKEVLERRRQHRYDSESVELSARLLALNPEVYTLWNYRLVRRSITCCTAPQASLNSTSPRLTSGPAVNRREALKPVLEGPDAAAAAEAVKGELQLTLAALRSNPKSYSTWHHRRRMLETGLGDLRAELDLVKT